MTPLDTAHAAMEAAPDDVESVRFDFAALQAASG